MIYRRDFFERAMYILNFDIDNKFLVSMRELLKEKSKESEKFMFSEEENYCHFLSLNFNKLVNSNEKALDLITNYVIKIEMNKLIYILEHGILEEGKEKGFKFFSKIYNEYEIIMNNLFVTEERMNKFTTEIKELLKIDWEISNEELFLTVCKLIDTIFDSYNIREKILFLSDYFNDENFLKILEKNCGKIDDNVIIFVMDKCLINRDIIKKFEDLLTNIILENENCLDFLISTGKLVENLSFFKNENYERFMQNRKLKRHYITYNL